MIRKNLIKSLSVIMAAMLAVMTVACGKATENIETAAVEVQQDDTPQTLQRRVMEEAEWQIMPKAIDLIANNRVTVENGLVKVK